MTVIGNNSANNSNTLANINITGSKDSVSSSGVTSFLDVISMLSSSDLDLKDISKSNTLISNLEVGSEPSTLKLQEDTTSGCRFLVIRTYHVFSLGLAFCGERSLQRLVRRVELSTS